MKLRTFGKEKASLFEQCCQLKKKHVICRDEYPGADGLRLRLLPLPAAGFFHLLSEYKILKLTALPSKEGS